MTPEEIELKKEELALRRQELSAQLEHQRYERKRAVSPLALAVVATGSGLASVALTAFLNYTSEAKSPALICSNLLAPLARPQASENMSDKLLNVTLV